jgi:hypothetical protein
VRRREFDAIVHGLRQHELDRLARYNSEVWHGIVHTDEHRALMAELQSRFDADPEIRP